MAKLSSLEKLKFEKLFGMSSGYVVNFSNRTFSEFVLENTGIEIFDSKYEYGSSSKANRLRKFWQIESNTIVGKLLFAFLEYWVTDRQINDLSITQEEQSLYDECLKIAERLSKEKTMQEHRVIGESSNRKRPIKVFLSYTHADAKAVYRLYKRLAADGVEAWLDKEKLLPGQDWELEIRKAVREADVVIVCLSKQLNQAGFQQKEVRWAIDTAMEKLEGEIFIIPVRLEECDAPEKLQKWHWVDLFSDGGYEKIAKALSLRAEKLNAVPLRKAKPKQVQREFGNLNLVGQIGVLSNLGTTHIKLGDFVRAIKYLEQALSLSQSIGDKRSETSILVKLASVYENTGDLIKALDLYEQALDISNSIGYRINAVKTDNDQAPLSNEHTAKISTSKKRKSIKTEYVVAIIGAAATIIAGILGSPLIEKWFTASPTPTPTTTATLSTLTSVELPTQAVTLTFIPTIVAPPTFTPLPTEITDAKGITMRLVPAGEFTMGSNNGVSDDDEKPVHQVYLDAFYMDIYEVTNAAYKACVDSSGCTPPHEKGPYTYTNHYSNSQYDDYPVDNADWNQAKTYCEWRGGGLPTEAQWEKAARGTDGRTYPWGEGISCDKANYNNCKGDMTPVGSYESGKSPYGMYDMAGNVWEWVNDWYSETYYQSSPFSNPLGPSSGEYHVTRSSSWFNGDIFVFSAYRNLTPDPFSPSIGFRCARSTP